VLDLIAIRISDWQKKHQENTILPLSGGLDSRLLLHFLPEKNRIKSFTYGVGSKQEDSWEVVHAQYLAQKFGVDWKQIILGDFMLLNEEWYADFGISTHLHGMYQMEFYKKIRADNQSDTALLSGMVGDAWAGSIFSNQVLHPKDIAKLGYAHGWAAEPKYLKEKPKHNHLKISYFEANQKYISHPLFSVIETIRTKNMLLKYLLQVPEKLGFELYAPFIEEDIALAMLRLPEEQRKKRKWQQDYFGKLGLNLENLPLKRSYSNDIDQYAALRNPIEPLSKALLGEIIEENYIHQINSNMLNSFQSRMEYKLFKHLGTTKGFRRFLKDKFVPNYAAYTTLYPLQRLILARNEYFNRTHNS
jgi:asparagine synthetase B (glutamine-hydrolysing)